MVVAGFDAGPDLSLMARMTRESHPQVKYGNHGQVPQRA
jgi:hypothetical protein